MKDEDFLDLLKAYLDPPGDPNSAMAGIRLEWIRGDPNVGSLHMQKHGVTESEVEEVLFQIPPVVEAKRSRKHPNRTLFRGATKRDRWLVVVCEDRAEAEERILTPITAFEPDEGEAYWERL